MFSGVRTYDNVAVEQVFLLASWTRPRTSVHRVGDEVEGADVDKAVFKAGVVEEAEDAVAAIHKNQRRRLRQPMVGIRHVLQTMSE